MTNDEVLNIAVQFEGRCFDYQGFARAIERSALERASDIAFDYVFTAMNAVEARKLKNAILEDAQSKDTEGA